MSASLRGLGIGLGLKPSFLGSLALRNLTAGGSPLLQVPDVTLTALTHLRAGLVNRSMAPLKKSLSVLFFLHFCASRPEGTLGDSVLSHHLKTRFTSP